ncbi:MAG TPA: HEAT repeat domain-containing protein [Terriglobales bacterium]|nr:HEAT repeat domain-containing protein [Terriglobales bacterium]
MQTAVQELVISGANTSQGARAASARAFVHSLNILIKYARMYGYEHKRTEAQFETTWSELQTALPAGGDAGFLLGVSDNKLLLDGIPLESGQAEKSFATLLSTAGLASLHFSKEVTEEDFVRLVRAFTIAGSKATDVAKQIKDALGAGKQNSTIKINEVKFVAADPLTGDVSIAAQIAAQTLGPEFKQWLNDPQKMLQLIAAAEGAASGGGKGGDGVPMVPLGSIPTTPAGKGGDAPLSGTPGPYPASAFGGWFGGGGGSGSGGPGGPGTGGRGGPGGGFPGGPGGGGGAATGVAPGWVPMVPLQEQEVIQAIRLLTRFGQVQQDPGVKEEDLKKDIAQADPNTRLNLQQLLGSLAAQAATAQEEDTPLLMKAAEHMAIRFALERYQKGEVKVNAVHQMMEHMSRQMDSLRQILRLQEEKMNKAGLLVESHADILDRMFWAEVPEAGKKSVLLSHEAPCVPPRNLRQFVELLLERDDKQSAAEILNNYSSCLSAKEAEPRRRTAIGLSQVADLYARLGGQPMAQAIRKLSEQVIAEKDAELQSLYSAAFVRLSQEASAAKNYAAVNEVCAGMELISVERPVLISDLRPRVGVENRLPEYIEEALQFDQVSADLLSVLRRTSQSGSEHLADRFFRCMRRDECDRMIEMVKQLGSPILSQLREILRTGQPRQASGVVGLVSRLDVGTLLELLPARLPEWNRFYHDVAVRQIAYGAAADRGRTLLELAEVLDPVVLPEAVDEIGMSGDRGSVSPLIAMAKPGDAASRSPLVQLKAIESLGRIKDAEAVPILREILETKKTFGWLFHRELRIAAAQALSKTDPRYSSQVLSDSGLEPSELAIAPLDMAPACPWVRQRRYERLVLAKTVNGTLGSSWGKSRIVIRELSLGGGMGTKEDNLRIGSEAELEISVGMRSKIRAHVLLRRARVNEVGFEIVNTDLDSRHKLRRLLVEALNNASQNKSQEWGGERKV